MNYLVVILTFAACCTVADGGNLLFNSSFELGIRGCHVMSDCPEVKDYQGSMAKIDNTVAKFGVNSLRVDASRYYPANPYNKMDLCKVITHDFHVQPEMDYTFSVWVKAKRPCKFTLALRSKQRTGARHPDGTFKVGYGFNNKNITLSFPRRSFQADGRWKRVVFPFKTAKGHSAYCAQIHVDGGALWLDGLQVEKGPLTDYAPASPVEAAVYVNRNLLVEPKKVDGRFVAISYQKSLDNFQVSLTMRDRWYRKNIASQDLLLNLKGGKAQVRNFSFDVNHYGAFTVFTNLQPNTTPASFRESRRRSECPALTKRQVDDISYQSEALFLSLHKLPVQQPEGFKMGLEMSNGVGYPKINIVCSDSIGDYDTQIQMARSSGGMVRSYVFAWRENEPRKGEFNWKFADSVIDAQLKNGLTPIALFCPRLFNMSCNYRTFHNQGIPDWAAKRDRLGHPEGTTFTGPANCTSRLVRNILPQLDDWRDYIYALATHFKGRILYYEIFNEPYWYFTDIHYVEYLKVAYDAIKSVDPEAKVLGIGRPAGRGWLRPCLVLEAYKYCDIVAIHPYDMDDTLSQSAMELLRRTRRVLNEYGVDKPIWDTETFFTAAGGGNRDLNWRANGIARRYIIDMGEGLGCAVPTIPTGSNLVQPTANPLQCSNYSWLVSQPTERFAIINATASFIRGAIPLKTIELPGNVLVYVFKKGTRLFSVQWVVRGAATMKAIAPKDGVINSYDLFGNCDKKRVKEVKLSLGRSPVFIEWINSSAQDIIKAISAFKVTVDGATGVNISLKKVNVQKRGDSFSIVMDIENGSSFDIKKGVAQLRSSEIIGACSMRSAINRSDDFSPGKVRTVKFDNIKLSNPDLDAFKVKLDIFCCDNAGKQYSTTQDAMLVIRYTEF